MTSVRCLSSTCVHFASMCFLFIFFLFGFILLNVSESIHNTASCIRSVYHTVLYFAAVTCSNYVVYVTEEECERRKTDGRCDSDDYTRILCRRTCGVCDVPGTCSYNLRYRIVSKTVFSTVNYYV